tara:strand:+ start:388 stop:933 length:546 start_codon:yes stop_codon:yes gene_type:complete
VTSHVNESEQANEQTEPSGDAQTAPEQPEKKVLTEQDLIGSVVKGEVTNVTNFGAFVRLENGEEGLVHISEIANEFVTNINDFVKAGQTLDVKVLARNSKKKLELSIKQVGSAGASGAPSVKSTTSAPSTAPRKEVFVNKKSSDTKFEDKMTAFMKRSEEKQIDIRRNLKNKYGLNRKRKV